jgi:hypothetical protein
LLTIVNVFLHLPANLSPGAVPRPTWGTSSLIL